MTHCGFANFTFICHIWLFIYLGIFCISSIYTSDKAPRGLMNCWRICFWRKPLRLNHLPMIIVFSTIFWFCFLAFTLRLPVANHFVCHGRNRSRQLHKNFNSPILFMAAVDRILTRFWPHPSCLCCNNLKLFTFSVSQLVEQQKNISECGQSKA